MLPFYFKIKLTSIILFCYRSTSFYCVDMSRRNARHDKPKPIPGVAAYYINCYRHASRREKFQDLAAEAGIRVTRVACFDARKINDNLVCDLRDDGELSKRADLTPVEVAINYSHFKCWERFLRSKNKYCLVFEDDVHIYKRFRPKLIQTIKFLEENNIRFGILHLWNGNWSKTKSKLKKVAKVSSDISLSRETIGYTAGGTCYLLTRDFAQYLMGHIFPIKSPVDIYIGGQVRRSSHLTVETTTLADGCIKTPFIYVDCSGPYGTGASTTQQYEVPTVDETSC